MSYFPCFFFVQNALFYFDSIHNYHLLKLKTTDNRVKYKNFSIYQTKKSAKFILHGRKPELNQRMTWNWLICSRSGIYLQQPTWGLWPFLSFAEIIQPMIHTSGKFNTSRKKNVSASATQFQAMEGFWMHWRLCTFM